MKNLKRATFIFLSLITTMSVKADDVTGSNFIFTKRLDFETTGTNVTVMAPGVYGVGGSISRKPLYFVDGKMFSERTFIELQKNTQLKDNTSYCSIEVSADKEPRSESEYKTTKNLVSIKVPFTKNVFEINGNP